MDFYFIQWLNHHLIMVPWFNKVVHAIADRDEFKGLFFMIIFWACWFTKAKNSKYVQNTLIGTLIGCLTSLFISRLITDYLPNRPRPMIEPALGFQTPVGLTTDILPKMSSFPSDHAALFFGMALGFTFISRRLGVMLMIYISCIIAIPRFYLGYHYPTDIIAGMLIGFICVFFIVKNGRIQQVIGMITNLETTRPNIFYPALFFITFEFSTMFDDLRHFASMILHKSL